MSSNLGYVAFSELTTLDCHENFHATITYNGSTFALPVGVNYDRNWCITGWTTTTSRVAYTTPLMLDLNGDGVQTLAIDSGVQFDLLNTGTKQSLGWISQTRRLAGNGFER